MGITLVAEEIELSNGDSEVLDGSLLSTRNEVLTMFLQFLPLPTLLVPPA